jgi:hypothetical protein
MDKYSRAGILVDIYGGLLTERQSEALSLYLSEDCSLSEISEKLSVSRQAVHDIIKRSMNQLEEYESKLKLYERSLSNRETEKQIAECLKENDIKKALSLVHAVVEK